MPVGLRDGASPGFQTGGKAVGVVMTGESPGVRIYLATLRLVTASLL